MAEDRDRLAGDRIDVGEDLSRPTRMTSGAEPVAPRHRDDRVVGRDPDLDRSTAAGETDITEVRPMGTTVPDGHQDEHLRVRPTDLDTRGSLMGEARDVRPIAGGDLGTRAQPGDVLGIDTGGETTSLGDTARDEDERRENAERDLRDLDRDRG